MEPRQEEQRDKVTRTEEKEEKPRRFRIVKLEERIAPGHGHGNGSNNFGCGPSNDHCCGYATC